MKYVMGENRLQLIIFLLLCILTLWTKVYLHMESMRLAPLTIEVTLHADTVAKILMGRL